MIVNKDIEINTLSIDTKEKYYVNEIYMYTTTHVYIYPLKRHIYIVNGYTYISYYALKHRCVPTINVLSKDIKSTIFFLMNFHFLQLKIISVYCMYMFL